MENVPIYVKVDKYNELVEVLRAINTKLNQVDKTIERINQLKEQEEAQLGQWGENLVDIRSRLEKINQSFYE